MTTTEKKNEEKQRTNTTTKNKNNSIENSKYDTNHELEKNQKKTGKIDILNSNEEGSLGSASDEIQFERVIESNGTTSNPPTTVIHSVTVKKEKTDEAAIKLFRTESQTKANIQVEGSSTSTQFQQTLDPNEMDVEETVMEELLSKGLTSPAKRKWKPENSVVQYKKQHNTSDTNFNLVMNAIDQQLATTWDDPESNDSDLEDDKSRLQSPTNNIQEENNTTDWVPKEDETMQDNSQTVNSCTSTQVITSSTTVTKERTVSGQNTEKSNTVKQGVASTNTTPSIQIPRPKKVRFGTNFVMTTTNKSSLQEVLKQRGMQMTDNQKKMVTPTQLINCPLFCP